MEYLYISFNKETKEILFQGNKATHTHKGNILDIVLQGNIIGFENYMGSISHICKIYSEKGIEYLLKTLNGSYNIAIYDKNKSKIYVFSDRYGSRPLFKYDSKGLYVFSSRISEITKNLVSKLRINYRGLSQYLTFRFTLGTNTFFNEITWTDNGMCYEIDTEKNLLKEYKYWSYSKINIDTKTSFVEKITQGTQVFANVFTRLSEDLNKKKFVVGLSSGYDSRSIVAGLLKYGNLKSHTVTTLHPYGLEKAVVTKLAKKLEIRNKYIERPDDIYRKYYLAKNSLTDSLVQEHLWSMPLTDYLKNFDYYIDGIAGDIIMRSTRVRPIHISKFADAVYLSKLLKKQFGFEFGWLKEYVDSDVWEKIRYNESYIVEEFDKLPKTKLRTDIFLMKNRVRNGISLSSNNALGNFVENVYQPFFDNEMVEF